MLHRKSLAADLDARQSGYRRRAFTFGLITTCGNAPAVSASVVRKTMAPFQSSAVQNIANSGVIP